MNIARLLFSSRGRLDRRGFAVGAAIVFVADLAASQAPLVGPLATLLLLWPAAALLTKRLKDCGRSGATALLPVAGLAFASLASMLVGAVAEQPPEAITGLAATGVGALIALPAAGGALAFALYAGLMVGDAGRNRFGPAVVRPKAARSQPAPCPA